MQHRGWYDDDWRRRRDGEGRGGAIGSLEGLRNALVETGLWASSCLALASLVPPMLVAPVLRELLLFAAAAVSVTGLLRGEALSLRQFNRQDVALVLLFLALIAGFFIDHAALAAMTQGTDPGLS